MQAEIRFTYKACPECRGRATVTQHLGTPFPMPDAVIGDKPCWWCGGEGIVVDSLAECSRAQSTSQHSEKGETQ